MVNSSAVISSSATGFFLFSSPSINIGVADNNIASAISDKSFCGKLLFSTAAIPLINGAENDVPEAIANFTGCLPPSINKSNGCFLFSGITCDLLFLFSCVSSSCVLFSEPPNTLLILLVLLILLSPNHGLNLVSSSPISIYSVILTS